MFYTKITTGINQLYASSITAFYDASTNYIMIRQSTILLRIAT